MAMKHREIETDGFITRPEDLGPKVVKPKCDLTDEQRAMFLNAYVNSAEGAMFEPENAQVIRSVWVPASMPPVEVGSYLVATANGKLRMDRWDGEQWGLCRPRNELKTIDKGRYKPHKAWCSIPPYRESEN